MRIKPVVHVAADVGMFFDYCRRHQITNQTRPMIGFALQQWCPKVHPNPNGKCQI